MTAAVTKPMRAKLLKMTTERRAFTAHAPNTVERRLLAWGYVALEHRNGPNCSPTGADLTDVGWQAIGMHLVDCDGEAHSNLHIDNCMACAPRWGKVAIPAEYPTLSAYRGRNFDPLDK